MSEARGQACASELRRECEIEERCFDLEGLLADMGVTVVDEALRSGVDGLCFDGGDNETIIVQTGLGRGRRRFTLGHELGHLLLGHGSAPCSTRDVMGVSSDGLELEANAFCVSLLMPRRLFSQDSRRVEPRLDQISSELAYPYGVSTTAAALRYRRFTREACAVVGVRSDRSLWVLKSKAAEGWWIHQQLPDGSVSRDALANRSDRSSGQVSASTWIENFEWESDCLIQEEIVQTSQESWLILLSDLPDPDDDPDWVEKQIDAELDRRRRSFRRY